MPVSEQGKAALSEYIEADTEGARRLQSRLSTASELKDKALAKTDEHLAAFAQTAQGRKTVKLVEQVQKEVSHRASQPSLTPVDPSMASTR